MSLAYRLFPSGAPPADTDKILISRADVTSPTGFSNYLLTWAELKATVTGSGGNGANGAPGMDGVDGEDGFPVPGPIGATGPAGPAGSGGGGVGAPGIDGADAEEPLVIPGPRGANGANGANGASGTMLLLLESEIEEPVAIPGQRGADGAPGPAGGELVTTTMFIVDAEIEEPLLVPGPKGDKGATGGGGGGGSITAATVTVSTPARETSITVVDASVTATDRINVEWGNCAQIDENHPGMGMVAFNAVPAAGQFTLEMFSLDTSMLFGAYKINYSIAA